MRVLLACRDAGAAMQLLAVSRALRDAGETVVWVTTAPATSLVRGAGEVVAWDSGDATAALDATAPHVVLTGVSAPGSSIECTVTRAARTRGIPVAALQDYWGCVHDDPAAVPDVWLVLDEVAAQLTRAQTPAAACRVVGSPRHESWIAERSSAWPRWSAAPVPRILVAGQPLWHLADYGDALTLAARSIAEVAPDATVWYLQHPSEGDVHAAVTARFAKQAVTVAPAGDLATTLLTADVLLSVYSLLTWDLLQLHAAMPVGATPPAMPIVLPWTDRLRAAHAAYAGNLEALPYAATLREAVTTDHASLRARLAAATQEDLAARAAGRAAMQQRIASAMGSTQRGARAAVIQSLRELVANRS